MHNSKSALLLACVALLSLSCSDDNRQLSEQQLAQNNFDLLSSIGQKRPTPEDHITSDPVQTVAYQYALNLFSGDPSTLIKQLKPDVQLSAAQLEKVRPADLVKDFALYLSALKKKCDNAGGIRAITTSKPSYSSDGYLANVKISVSFKDTLQTPHEEIVTVKKYGAEWLPLIND